ERDALLGIGSGPRVAYPVDRTIHELFEEQVIVSGDRVAAVHNGAEIRYAQLNRRANQIAHRLLRYGVERGSFVGILDKRGIDFLAAILGVLKAGGAFVSLDPAYPEDRLRHMIGDSQIEAIITRSSVLKTLSFDSWFKQPQRLVCLDEGLGDESADNPSPVSASRDLAYMLYTSGSTGLPKGAMIRHDGAIN